MALQHASRGGLAPRLFATNPAARLALVQAAWVRAVGPDLARRTEVMAIDGTTLRVRVPDARWRTVLHRMQRDIVRRLGELAGDLAPRRLGFIEGPMADAPADAPAAPAPDENPDAGERVREASALIPDPELREAFLRTAGRYLSRKRGSTP